MAFLVLLVLAIVAIVGSAILRLFAPQSLVKTSRTRRINELGQTRVTLFR